MKKNPFLFLAFAFFWVPAPSSADYLVLLKKGTEFVVPDYWVDKEGVSFFMDGGKVAIPRTSVQYIYQTRQKGPGLTTQVQTISFGKKSEYATEELKVEMEEKVGIQDEAKELVQDQASAERKPSSSWDRILGEIAFDKALREKGRELAMERESAKQAFVNAKMAGDKEAQKKSGQAILRLGEERSRLLEEVRKANQGEIPGWWNEMM